VPHLLAHYSVESNERLLIEAPELFNFYKQYTQEDLRRFIKKPPHFKGRHQIQRLNKRMKIMDEFEQSKICLNDECLLNYDMIHCQNIEII
jgi:hypothetical protein